MRNLALSLCLVDCASTEVTPRCTGQVIIDQKAVERAAEYHRDGVAFAIPGIGLSAAGMVAGAIDISLKPNEPAWLRGTSLGLVGAGVLSSIIAYTFSSLSLDEQAKSQKCVERSDASRR